MTKHIRETRVLVLYTGGTIGMKKTDGGKYFVKSVCIGFVCASLLWGLFVRSIVFL